MTEPSTEARNAKRKETPLEAWIERATHGLCAQAKERVRKEITAHYSEAVEDSCDSGLSPDVARAQAAEGLGDAATANRALRKTYLTTWQQRLLAGLAQPVAPLKIDEYEASMTAVSTAVLFGFQCVAHDYGTSFQEAFAIGLNLLPICAFYIRWRIRTSCNRKHRSDDTGGPPTEIAAMNKLYPWVLMVCALWLYVIWQVQYQVQQLRVPPVFLFFIPLLATYLKRLHREMGSCCFHPSQDRGRTTTVLAFLCLAFMLFVSAACVLWQPSWEVLNGFVRDATGSIPSTFFSNRVYPESDDLRIFLPFYGVAGIVLSLIIFVVAIRWTIGLYLLRKDVNGDGTTETGPVSSPETPLGE